MSKYQMQSDVPVILHTKDLKVENGVMYLPVYMAALL